MQDRAAIEDLIARSTRALTSGVYSPRQVESALRALLGVDTQLIRDGTYYVAVAGGVLVGCGGWSRRRTLYGGDARGDRDAAELDPHKDAARIRAFFVDPDCARKGIGRAILERCESEARRRGFARFELMAMLSGVDFYLAHGYAPGALVQHELERGLAIGLLPMSKIA